MYIFKYKIENPLRCVFKGFIIYILNALLLAA